MERIPKNISKHIGGVKIYVEGLERIIDVLSREDPNVELTTDEFRFQNLEDLLSKYEKSDYLQYLSIKISNPRISVSFDNNKVFIYASDNDALSSGLFLKVENIIKSYVRPIYILSNGFIYFPSIILLMTLVVLGGKFLPANIYNFLVPVAIGVSIFWAFLYAYLTFPHSANIVVPRRQSEGRGFFIRNRDSLILVLISALFGSIFTLLGTHFYTNYFGASNSIVNDGASRGVAPLDEQ